MADSFTGLLRLRQQATGANNNTWGALLNAAAFQLIEDSLAGRLELTVAGVDITLSTNNGSNDQARMAILSLTGAPGATRNIIIPNSSKWYVVENKTNAIQNVKTSTGAALPVAVGERKFLLCDGANGVFGIADTLGGLDASAFAKLASRNSYSAGNSDVPRDLVDGATITMDLALGNVFKVTLGGDRILSITNPVDGSWAELYVAQDSTGARDLDFPANILWEGGVEPTQFGIPNVTQGFLLRYDSDISLYYGRELGVFAASGSGTVLNTTLSDNEFNVDIFERAGRPSGAATITVTIPAGVLIASMDPATPALDFAGFVAGSIINIINNGDIQGCGGKGARGGSAGDANSANLFFAAANASPGGDAIRLPAAACTISITNPGRIWGGGGGGGGGGPSHDGDGSDVGATGGGGGGGAGGGEPGEGGSHCAAKGSPGTPGGRGRNGTFGTGGAGASSGGTGTPAAGGNGGDWGAAGSNGTAATAQTFDAPAGTGGAAGKAINQNGGSAPSFVSGSAPPNVKGAVA